MANPQDGTRTSLKILMLPVCGVFETNCYLAFDESRHSGVLIDPGAQADAIFGLLEEQGLRIDRIVLTHGHFDHWGAAAQLRDRLGCPIAAHASATELLGDPALNLSARFGRPLMLTADEVLSDGDRVVFAENTRSFCVMHLPGHTPDSIALYSAQDNVAFVGDTLYDGRLGLTCYPKANARDLGASIERLLGLPSSTLFLPGHGGSVSSARLADNLPRCPSVPTDACPA